MNRRTLRLNSLLQLCAVIAITVFANRISAERFTRLDITADRVHTLSQAARHLMGRLEKPLIVRVWFTRGLETPYNNHEQILVDKLEELRAWSDGRMELQVVDPTGDEAAEAEAQSFGVRPIQYSFRSNNRSEQRQVYMGLAMLYGDQQQIMPAVTSVDAIEYDLARAIKSPIEGGERKTIGYLTGHGEPDLLTARGPVETLRNKLQERYDLEAVELSPTQGVPDAVDALLIVGPQGPISLREQYHLDQYLMQGEPLLVFLSNHRPDMRSYRLQPIFHGMEAFLGHHGIQLNRDLVIDRGQNGMLRFPMRQGNFIVQQPTNYPLIPLTAALSEDSPVVNGLDQMQLPFVSSLELAEAQGGGEVAVEVLFRSGEQAGRAKRFSRIDPASLKDPLPDEEAGQWALGAMAVGEFTSFFAGKPVPQAPESAEPDPPLITDSARNRLFVAGSADMIANNLSFMQNLLDWALEDEELIGIRSKTVQTPPLELPEPSRLQALKLANLLGPALLLLVVGGIRQLVRRGGGA